LFIGATFVAIENHRTDSIPNDSYPVKSDRLLGAASVQRLLFPTKRTGVQEAE